MPTVSIPANKRRVALHFDNSGLLRGRDAEKWARSVARQNWGAINAQWKVAAKGLPGQAWYFSCVGHEGYILVAPSFSVPKYFDRFAVDGVATWDKNYTEKYASYYGYLSVYAFEEDVAWAILEATYPQVAEWARNQFYPGKEAVQHRADIQNAIEQYYPELAQELNPEDSSFKEGNYENL